MSEMRINRRPEFARERSGYKSRKGSYPEYVFNKGVGGGKVLAHGLDGSGHVLAIVYAPGPLADANLARSMAGARMMCDVPEVSRVRFSPFKWGDGA